MLEMSDRDWEKLVDAINIVHKLITTKPPHVKAAFSLDPGSILNAYREGDVTFFDAIHYLEKWKESK